MADEHRVCPRDAPGWTDADVQVGIGLCTMGLASASIALILREPGGILVNLRVRGSDWVQVWGLVKEMGSSDRIE